MLAASRFGQTNRFAGPSSVLSERMVLRRSASRGAVAVHLAVDLQTGALSRSSASACRILSADSASEAAKVGMRQQRDFGLDAEAAHRVSGHCRDFGDLVGTWIEVDVRIDEEQLAVRKHESVHRRVDAGAGALADHPFNIMQMACRGAARATEKPVALALAQQHRADQRSAATHFQGAY